MTDQFNRILEVPKEERDRVQRLQVIDRAAAAIAAARALIKEPPPSKQPSTSSLSSDGSHASAEYSGSGHTFIVLPLPSGFTLFRWIITTNRVVLRFYAIWAFSAPTRKPSIFSKHAPLPPLQSLVEVEAEIVDYPLSTSEPLPINREKRWEDKFWEAADEFDHKELGSEKSGRDSAGNWGKNGAGDEWHEKWWEHYDWCSIDPTTPLDAGHAHVWHESCDGWAKWGDKWDEDFDKYGNGVKQDSSIFLCGVETKRWLKVDE
ncbi:unnamed protein product [Spirodela intermedia]|uniref:Uncharacterized protein n=1 Tax=Spirodela intermedia TaxID=51605 RepID=A0A7I8JAI4_SPIIN|nr:unnamed protein product [Spirodela intermedia]CAA6667226.1 unnamed protein product [Spirodela intermedia]